MKNFILVILASALFLSCEEMLLGPEPGNTPENNFEILWKTFDENYALFRVKDVDWDSLHAFYGSQISSSTTEFDLWDITTEMLLKLNDGHVKLFNKGFTRGFYASELSKRNADDFSLDLVKNKFLDNIKIEGDGYFTYGKIQSSFSGKNIGYIHIATFTASHSGNGIDWAYDIDNIVQELYDSDALIIDLRNNGGGLKVTLGIIASAFIDREILYFYQREKTGPRHNDFGEPIPLIVSPRPDVLRFTKKIALLTNRFSASGSEHFTQIFENLTYSTHIGDTTFGAFGDIINTAQLPNGWTYNYPCRLTTTPDGKCYEGTGLVPDVLVENTKADITAGIDNVMEYAVEYLSE